MFPSHAGSVLVVDHDVDYQRLLTRLLLVEGYHVLVAGSAARALALVRATAPDLIMLDMALPDAHGATLCCQLRDLPALQHTPIICMTAAHPTCRKRELVAVAGVDYIAKPFQANEVLARVGMHLMLNRQQQGLSERNAELEQANQQLVQALAANNALLSSMSRELRMPLSAMLGLAEVLNAGAYGPLDERQLAVLRMLVANGRHLLSLINDLLELAQLDAGHTDLPLLRTAGSDQQRVSAP